MSTSANEPIPDDLYCPNCGYNLRGLFARSCPECGEPFDPSSLRDVKRDRIVSPWLEALFGALALIGAYPFFCFTSGVIMYPALSQSRGPSGISQGIAVGLSVIPLFIASGCHAKRLSRLQCQQNSAIPAFMQARTPRRLWWLVFFVMESTLVVIVYMGLSASISWFG